MKLMWGLVALLFLAMPDQGLCDAPRARLALVVGVSDYDRNGDVDTSVDAVATSQANGFAADLANPRNDALDMAAVLEGMGYEVAVVLDPDSAALAAAFDAFGQRVAAAPADQQVVVFFAGHGVLVDKEAFLIPAGARLPDGSATQLPAPERRAMLEAAGAPLSGLMTKLARPRDAGGLLVLLDSCRDNPWRASFYGGSTTLAQALGNLAVMSNMMEGLATDIGRHADAGLIAYAASASKVAEDGDGRNSPFTTALKQHIATPELTTYDMLWRVREEVQRATQGRQLPTYNMMARRELGVQCLVSCPPETTATPRSP